MNTSNNKNDGHKCTPASTTPAQTNSVSSGFLEDMSRRFEARRYLRLQLLYLAEELCELNEILTPDLPLKT